MDVMGDYGKGKIKGPISITSALTSAFLEWLLMIFLFIDGGFAYLVTKFAQYCQLQVPCLLCSRLDHVLGKERAGFYWELICPNHKYRISSLVLCHNHNNLVDVHGMCESCLFSFATVNKSNAETYRLLVGKLGAEPYLTDEDPLLEEKTKSSSGVRKCYCCEEEFVTGGYAKKLFKITSSCADTVELDAPLSVTNGQERGDPKEIENEASTSVSVFVPSPRLEYKKVKVVSDSESEAAHSDSDSASPLIRARDYSIDDLSDRCLHPEPQIFTVTDDFATEKLIHSASVPEPSLLDQEIDLMTRDFSSVTTSDAVVGLGSEEVSWQQPERKTDASVPSDLISFDEVNQLSDVKENIVDLARETSGETVDQVVEDCGEVSRSKSDEIPKSETELDSKPEPTESTLKTDDAFDLGDAYKLAVGNDCGEVSRSKSDEIPKSETELDSKPEPNESSSQADDAFDLGDAYKLAVGNKGRQLSEKFLEQRSFKDSTRMSEDLKVLLTQLSAARGTDSILSEMSPRMSVNGEEFRTLEASSSIGMQILHQRISLERNESGLSLEGSTVSEIEGESVSDRLKRQVEYDRKLMAALYRELEEERNASSVAANQAMAMITRLQEEKAALHMEALQCLRMMEEQAEYDSEALQNANDLLAQKEKEIQDFETKLELYKKKLGNMALFEDALEASYDSNKAKQADTMCSDDSSAVHGDVIAHNPTSSSRSGEVLTPLGVDNIDNGSPLLDLESEREQLVLCLNKLEERLHLLSKHEACQDFANGNCEFSTEEWVEVGNPEELDHRESSRSNGKIEENVPPESITDRSPSGEEVSISKFPESLQKGRDGSKSGQCTNGDSELVSLKNELSVLSSRLEALGIEHSFLDQSINSLRNGKDGHRLIEEIAGHLRQLHFVFERSSGELAH
ncbi:myosin-binding protein 1-like isoform X2 [Solanum pennellii]|uniref:Myosin-binding protein 1-like isoform X2 n=1 Tax=Solanum pennellii TaxID=28526 RepID=A0ABM1FWL3_SOLPN|nr:myosin-binding protein 1-like isoform X2 [Solanum pennellii]